MGKESKHLYIPLKMDEISTEPKEYCDHFYMTVHNVKNLQKIKLKIFFQIFFSEMGQPRGLKMIVSWVIFGLF